MWPVWSRICNFLWLSEERRSCSPLSSSMRSPPPSQVSSPSSVMLFPAQVKWVTWDTHCLERGRMCKILSKLSASLEADLWNLKKINWGFGIRLFLISPLCTLPGWPKPNNPFMTFYCDSHQRVFRWWMTVRRFVCWEVGASCSPPSLLCLQVSLVGEVSGCCVCCCCWWEKPGTE